MGLTSGTSIMKELIISFQHHVEDEDVRVDLYRDAISALEQEDWDCPEECLGKDPAYDTAYYEIYPDA